MQVRRDDKGQCGGSCSPGHTGHSSRVGRSAWGDDRRDSKALHDEVEVEEEGGGEGRAQHDSDEEEVEEGGEDRAQHDIDEEEVGDEGRAQHDNDEEVDGDSDGRDHHEVEGEVGDGDGKGQCDDKEGDEVHLVSVHGNPDHELPQKILIRLL